MLDVAALLMPLSEDNPCGEDLSFSAEFDAIQQARIEEDSSLDQGAWVTERRIANWPFVKDECEKLLTTRAKDIRLGFWYAEALIHIKGFSGYAVGLEVLNDLVTTFWQDLHPIAEDEDMEARINVLNWFVQQSNRLLKQTPLTQSTKHKLSYNDLESARQLKASMESNVDLYDEPPSHKITLEQFTESQAGTPLKTLQDSFQGFVHAKTAWDKFTSTLDQLLGLDAPAFAGVNKTFDLIFDYLERTLRDRGGLSTSPTSTAATLEQAIPQTTHGTMSFNPSAQGHIQNRQQAMQVLGQISDYFTTYEPHSPVSYMLKKTIRWANMPLHEWLAHVVKESNPLDSLNELLGVSTHHHDE